MKPKVLLVILGSILTLPVYAQLQARLLVTQTIDDSNVIALHGSVHPLAQSRFDRGAVADSFPVNRILLVLNRPPERDAALQSFLNDAHTRGSANFHKWITPDQFGERFGPADADVQAASAWLGSHGFRVSRTSKSRQFVEFSGTAGSVRDAFHTQIHQYNVNGETHYANAGELKIPAALASLVSGVSPMNDFRAKPMLRVLGQASYSRATHKMIPQWTLPTSSGNFYALAPEDVSTQYDLAPLYKAGVNGAGQTIGIINESNIDISLVQAYQKLFGLSSASPQLVIDGSDPGTLPDVSIEAYLDVEEAGAIAPGAQVNLYIGNANGIFTGDTEDASPVDPLYLAALRAVDDNQAGVLSVSFGQCEGFLQAAGNSLWSALWQQAAAQGQTVLVASGDSGSAGCDNATGQWTTEYGPAVNGLASTPWDVAVGGTDFYYSDYATGGASMADLWNQTNDGNYGSLKAPLPEQVWDTVYGLNAIGPYIQNTMEAIPAGGGGASECVNSSAATTSGGRLFACNSVTGSGSSAVDGYAKPSWQTGTGVPSDRVRDIPDVSLFAANGTNFSGYPICAIEGDCVPDASGKGQITIVGGTSASTPLMAAVMALVNQKYGRQGQANFTLYPLARQTPSAFHDITLGSNNMTCVAGSPGCTTDSNGDGFTSLQEYSATPGYDLASGLGSIDANVLVNSWNAITFKPTATTLQISPTTAQHGSDVSVTINVNSTSGGGTPQGSVTILADLTSTSAPPLGVFTLTNGAASGSITDLPGGTYEVWAEYAGDGAFAASQSAPQSMTISTVSSAVNLYGFEVPGQTLNPAAPCLIPPNQGVYEQATLTGAGGNGEFGPWPSGSSLSYWQVAPVAIVNGEWPNFGSGTGNVTFTVDGAPQATVALNSYGYATWIPPSTFNAGTHTIGATYSGDTSYSSSASTPYSMVVPQVTPTFSMAPDANCGLLAAPGAAVNCSFSAGDTLRVEVQMSMANCHVPTGAITVNLGSLSQNVTLIPGGLLTRSSYQFVGTPLMSGEAVFQNVPAGTYPVSATYAGDTNSLPTNSAAPNPIYGPPPTFTVVATTPPTQLLSTATTMFINPSSFDDTLWLDFGLAATVTGPSGSATPPTGFVDFFEDGLEIANGPLTPSGPNSATVDTTGDGLLMDVGSSQLKAVYSGDSVYQSSAFVESYQFTINTTAPDFLLAPQTPQLTVQQGGSGKIGLNLASLGGYSGTVSLTCAPSSSVITCSFSPAAVAVSGQASTTLTVNVSAQATALDRPQRKSPLRWPGAAGAFLFSMLFAKRFRKSALSRSVLLGLCVLASICTVSCGGSASTTSSSPPKLPTPAATAYSVLVTGAANGIVHNTTITVVVP